MSKQRLGSAGVRRAGSASNENTAMRDSIVRLQQELVESRAETQRVSEQLNCMMLLVKKAWQGDQKSAIDVANIVGVAPPDYDEATAGTISIVTTTPKSRALNNWAVLAIGLLNRWYKGLEEKTAARQQYYMHHRLAYLDEQLDYQRNVERKLQNEMAREAQHAAEDRARIQQQSAIGSSLMGRPQQAASQSLLRRSNSYSEGTQQRPQRVKSASHVERGSGSTFMTQPASKQVGPFNRPQSSKPSAKRQSYKTVTQQQGPNLTWADLMIDPARNKVPNGTTQGGGERSLYRLAPDNEPKSDNSRGIPYDHPARYDMDGLFEADGALGSSAASTRRRPVSAKQQRDSDAARSRPRSAVYVQGERPMKYEVVRPASAAVHNNRTPNSKSKPPSATSNGTRRPPSGKKTTTPTANGDRYAQGLSAQGMHAAPRQRNHSMNSDSFTSPPSAAQNGGTSQHPNSDDSGGADSGDDSARLAYNDATWRKLGIDLSELDEATRVPPMRVDIRPPPGVQECEQGVHDMHAMERQIRNSALALQKKLGISEQGLI